MIVVMESYWRGLSHVTGNASTIRVARAAYPDEPIVFLGERAQVKGVFDQLVGVDGVSAVEIGVPDEEASPYGRLPRDWRNVRKAFAQMPGGRGTLILCSAYKATLMLCAIARPAESRVVARLHGNLNEILRAPSRNPLRQALRLESGLARAHSAGIGLIVLEESIQKELVTMRPELAGGVHVLEEPATVDQESPTLPSREAPVRFGFLGVGTRDKGADTFLALVSSLGTSAGAKAEFELIGRLHPSLRYLPTDGLIAQPHDHAIPRVAFVERLRKCHYVCAFYDPQYYRLGASGVLLDAVAHRKPLIVTDIPFTRALFDRFGDIGEICGSQQDAQDAMTRLIASPDPDRYRRQVANLERVASARSVPLLAQKLRIILDAKS